MKMYLNTKEVSSMTGIPKGTLEGWRHMDKEIPGTSKIPYRRFGKNTVRYRSEDVRRYLDNNGEYKAKKYTPRSPKGIPFHTEVPENMKAGVGRTENGTSVYFLTRIPNPNQKKWGFITIRENVTTVFGTVKKHKFVNDKAEVEEKARQLARKDIRGCYMVCQVIKTIEADIPLKETS